MPIRPAPTANPVDSPPERFEEARRLGEGAEGGAWVALDRRAGARVVLKRVEPMRRAAVAHAFSVLRRAGSPHLPVPRELVDDPSGATWLVTDWVDGRALEAGPVPVEVALAEALALAHALAAIHAAGTHHGDPSLANAVVTPTRGLVLVDLGQLGRLGTGTPGFIAPEVLAGGGGPAADRFALGCVLASRLFGEVPWRRPEALVRVRSGVDVRARLDALAAGALVPARVRSILAHLLDPDPWHRLADTDALVEALARALAAARAGVDLRATTTWWLPARWPFVGPDLASALERAHVARIVAVAGPLGSGRGRVVEELIQSLQTTGERAAILSAADPAAFVAAWMGDAGGTVGLVDAPGWPELDGSGGDAAERASVLLATARLAPGRLVLPVDEPLAAALEGDPRAHVLRVRPWTEAETASALAGVLDGDDLERWAAVLQQATGGWPARVVRAATAAATSGVDAPRLDRVVEAIERAGAADAVALDRAQAAVVLELGWGGDTSRTRVLPPHLLGAGGPLPQAVAAARARMAGELLALARSVIHDRRHRGEPVGLALAIDADDEQAVIEALDRAPPAPATTEARALVSWVAEQTPPVAATLRVHAARVLLADGEAGRALEQVAPDDDDPACSFEAARALQRLGRAREALTVLGRLVERADADLSTRASGLRVRVLVDLGETAHAARVAAALRRRAGVAGAGAQVWSAYAALAAGDLATAASRLDDAEEDLGTAQGRDAAGVSARLWQLRGTLALDRGDIAAGQIAFDRAAAAFADAGEPVGGLALRGNACALAVATCDVAAGLAHGRAAVGGLLARRQVPALVEASLALAQHLARTGALDEGEALRDLVEALVRRHDRSDAALGRLDRIAAELAAARLGASADAAARLEVHARYVAAARRLEVAGLRREAGDALVRAAAQARMAGSETAAREELVSARRAAHGTGDATLALWLELETLALAVAVGEASAIDASLRALAEMPDTAALVAVGQREVAIARDRALAIALARRLGARHPAVLAALRRIHSTLEIVMAHTPPLDRSAVRASLVGDDDELFAVLEQIAAPAASGITAPSASGAASPTAAAQQDDARLERLLRIYRRIAREERLEPLLEQVVDAMMELTDAERGAMVVLQEGGARLEVTRELGDGDGSVRFSRSVIDRVLQTGEPVLSVDAAADDRFDGSRSISHLNLRSVLAAPLRFRGELLGAVYVDHRLRRGNFDEHDLAHVEEFADLAALAVAHARALAAVRAQTDRLEAQGRELAHALEAREVEVVGLREEVRKSVGPERRSYRGIVGGAPAIQEVYRLIDRLADADVPVVIYGESGTGKELVARAIHDAGERARGPFVAENCGAIPETLLESVLFGHAKGAFTGAQKTKAGLFEAAAGGTIFLDEVGETSPAMQTKLLRVLQEGEVRRVGENVSRKVDVRVIAASNRDLEAMVERGEFRRDLFYRIHVVKLALPPLRERPEDVPALVQHFLARHAASHALTVSPAAMRRLSGYAWPGNVRELENEVLRWAALLEGTVDEPDLSPAVRGAAAVDPEDLRIRPRIDRVERELIARALERTSGNQTRAAELLGLSRFGLQKKLRKLEDGGDEGEDE